MSDNRRINETIIPIAERTPVTGAQSGVNSIWVNMEEEYQILAIVQAGVVGTTCDMKLQQATDASGTGAKDISGKAITQLAATGVATIECSAYELDRANGFTFLSMDLTTVGATTAASCIMFGGALARYQPDNTSISDEDIQQTIT